MKGDINFPEEFLDFILWTDEVFKNPPHIWDGTDDMWKDEYVEQRPEWKLNAEIKMRQLMNNWRRDWHDWMLEQAGDFIDD